MYKKQILLLLLLLLGNLLLAQKDTILIDEICISSNRIPILYSESSRVLNIISKEEIRLAPVESLQDILKYVAGVDVRERGAEGVQADISTRGGSFEQTLVLLNGVKMNDPQTGHHNLNIPIDIESIERIEILEGSAARIYGQNAFTGAINIITSSDNSNNLKLNGFYASNNLYKTSLAANLSSDNLKQHLSFSSKASDGYTENTDFASKNIYYHAKIKSSYGLFETQLGYLEKDFGANSFYTPAFPNQYEEISSLVGNIKHSNGGEKFNYSSSYFWRRHKDYFLLKRDDPSFYQNNHLTDVFGSEYNFNYQSVLGKTAMNIEYRKEKLLSTSMGEDLAQAIKVKDRDANYLKQYERDVFSLSLEHSYSIKKLTLSAGVISNWNNDFGLGYYPGFDLNYKVNDNLRLITSINTSFRTPSFTELLYTDRNNTGNINLKPEESSSYEIGAKYQKGIFKAQTVFFHRKGKNIIDWVKPIIDVNSPWLAKNISELSTSGFELHFSFFPVKQNEDSYLKSFNFSYIYLSQDANTSVDFDSKYILDYLKHKATLSLQHKIYKKFSAAWLVTLQDREGGFTDFTSSELVEYDLFSTVNAKISWRNKFAIFYFDVNNVFDVSYYDFGNLEMSGRWLKIGAKFTLFDEN